MPIATIQLPNGKTAKIEVPEGATEEQILDFAKANFGDVGGQTRDSSFFEGVGQGTIDAVKGLTSMLPEPFASAMWEDKRSPAYNPASEAKKNREGAPVGYFAGQIAPYAVGEGALAAGGRALQSLPRIPAAAQALIGAATNPATIAGQAGLGAMTGAAFNEKDRLGAAAGGAIGGAAGAMLPGALQGLKTKLTPYIPESWGGRRLRENAWGGMLNDYLRNNLGQAINNLRRNAGNLVPGYQPMAGDIAKDPTISTFNRWVMEYDPRVMGVKHSNDVAIKNAGESLGDYSKMLDVIKHRAARTDPLYSQFEQTLVPVTQDLVEAVRTPLFKKAYQIAKKNAANRFEFVDPALEQMILKGEIPAEISGRALMDIKKAAQAHVNSLFEAGDSVSKAAGHSANNAYRRFLGYLNDNAPEYRAADQIFTDISKRVEQERLGVAMRDALVGERSTESLAALRPEMFLKKLKETARKTGYEEIAGNPIPAKMSQQQKTTIGQIRRTLKGRSELEGLGKGTNSHTAQMQGMRDVAVGRGLPDAKSIAAHIPGVKAVPLAESGINDLLNTGYRNMMNVADDMVTQPRYMADILDRVVRDMNSRPTRMTRDAMKWPGLLGAVYMGQYYD